MRAQIPKLEDYDVSPKTGFLPETAPVTRLSDPYYDPWEKLADNLPALILTRRLRDLVDALPVLSTARLTKVEDVRRACVVLGFLSHGYVWSGEKPSDHLPKQLAEPWVKVCEELELPAIVTYAGVCLWNFHTILPVDPEEWSLDNLATVNTFTGSIDESWFYLVSTAIERQGAPCLATGLEAIHACRAQDDDTVVKCLQTLAESIDTINGSLNRMYEMCDPHTFYFRIRPYLAGWRNMADAGLPKGVRYGDEVEYRQIAGGSNAQSSLIQALDILLDIEHHPTGERPNKQVIDSPSEESDGQREKKRHNFIHEMRTYMPGPHRRFLEELSQVSEIRDYVVEHGSRTPALTLSYDACLAMLRTFRDKHIQVVTRYIIMQAREAQRRRPGQSAETKREGLAASGKKNRGTGGTALIPFLKQARDETGDPAASSWGKRLLSENMTVMRKKRVSFSDDEPVKKHRRNPVTAALPSSFREGETSDSGSESSQVGLNGQWEVEDESKPSGHW